ncbi:MAG: hypothetical protein ABI867_08960 [Kofleriaceae bacterium]
MKLVVACVVVAIPALAAAEVRSEFQLGVNGGMMKVGEATLPYGGYNLAIGPSFGRFVVAAEYMLVAFSGDNELSGYGHRLGITTRFEALRLDVGEERVTVFAVAAVSRAWNRWTERDFGPDEPVKRTTRSAGIERRAGLGFLLQSAHAGFGFDATAAVMPLDPSVETCPLYSCKRAVTAAPASTRAIVGRMFWTYAW